MRKLRKNKSTNKFAFCSKTLFCLVLLALLAGCDKSGEVQFKPTIKEQGVKDPVRPNGNNGTPQPQVGICGVIADTCLSGTATDKPDTAALSQWACTGLNSGTTVACALPVEDTPPVLTDCVQVFYDDDGGTGRQSALMLLNLLGHFPQYQQIAGPIEEYQSGDIDRCQATFYLGTEYDNGLPDEFIEDYKNADMPVIWMGYNFWKLGDTFEEEFGFSEHAFDQIDEANLDSDGNPSFFRDVNYKGETFFKYNAFNADGEFIAPDEMVILRSQTSTDPEIMAEAENSFSGEIVPWAIRSGIHNRKFYVAEVPFEHIHEGSPYLVLADLLFDFLEESPRHNARYAVMRLDDVHPLTNRNLLQEAVSILHDNDIQPTISVIPHFNDPLFTIGGHADTPMVRMEDVPAFTEDIERYVSEGSVILWNGVTHQYDETRNPFTGASGDDFEFWDWSADAPIAEDNLGYVLTKLDDGFDSFALSGIEPQVWVTPNYHASAMDNLIFGQLFSWTLGRGAYHDFTATGFNVSAEGDTSLRFVPEVDNSPNRYSHFSSLSVVADEEYFHQFYPYEIYGDIYSQSVIPENLGNVQPFVTDQVTETRTVDEMLETARRNLVLRDVWASAFYHPFLLDGTINPDNADDTVPKDLERLVTGLQDLGYEFISVDDFASHHTTKAKPHLEIAETR